MSQVIPDQFQIKREVNSSSRFPLRHTHLTTTDFFRCQPVLAREMVPKDKGSVNVESFVRLFPMPFPTYGRIKYHNRAFFVPYRQLFRGALNFFERTPYYNGSSQYLINNVPRIKNSQLAFLLKQNYSISISGNVFLRSFVNSEKLNEYYLCDTRGCVLVFEYSSHPDIVLYFTSDGSPRYSTRPNQDVLDQFGISDYVCTYQFGVGSVIEYSVSNSPIMEQSTVDFSIQISDNSFFGLGSDRLNTPLTFSDIALYDQNSYDFIFGTTPYRFTRIGRLLYSLFCSLGYRIDFTTSTSSGVTSFSNETYYSAGKILAWYKVWLDYYAPSNFDWSLYYTIFRTESSTPTITYTDLTSLVNTLVVAYDRDYFTSAWVNPNSPNNSTSSFSIDIPDINISSFTQGSTTVTGSKVSTDTNGGMIYPGTPYIKGKSINSSSGSSPVNLTQYVLSSLSAAQQYVSRHQLAGYRSVDRYFARWGIRLSDDRAERAYYLGGYEYDAQISDVMSTAETKEGSLADYAGKGIAYSDRRGSFDFDCDEFGFLIVVASVVPDIGYVQGVMRENKHLEPLDFYTPAFDNLGTQAIGNDELLADYGMPSPDGNFLMLRNITTPSSVWKFAPRYSEYKVGYDFLTGDFAVPSRREGMDSYHLFRLFNGENQVLSGGASFAFGEQSQYDRIFNNTSDEYDHMFMWHQVDLLITRPMKSIAEVFDFEDGGKDETIAAEGSTLN